MLQSLSKLCICVLPDQFARLMTMVTYTLASPVLAHPWVRTAAIKRLRPALFWHFLYPLFFSTDIKQHEQYRSISDNCTGVCKSGLVT